MVEAIVALLENDVLHSFISNVEFTHEQSMYILETKTNKCLMCLHNGCSGETIVS